MIWTDEKLPGEKGARLIDITLVLAAIRPLLPAEQTYVNLHIPYCAGTKYLGPGDQMGTYEARAHQLNPFSLEEMPTDSLVALLTELKGRRAAEVTERPRIGAK